MRIVLSQSVRFRSVFRSDSELYSGERSFLRVKLFICPNQRWIEGESQRRPIFMSLRIWKQSLSWLYIILWAFLWQTRWALLFSAISYISLERLSLSLAGYLPSAAGPERESLQTQQTRRLAMRKNQHWYIFIYWTPCFHPSKSISFTNCLITQDPLKF